MNLLYLQASREYIGNGNNGGMFSVQRLVSQRLCQSPKRSDGEGAPAMVLPIMSELNLLFYIFIILCFIGTLVYTCTVHHNIIMISHYSYFHASY